MEHSKIGKVPKWQAFAGDVMQSVMKFPPSLGELSPREPCSMRCDRGNIHFLIRLPLNDHQFEKHETVRRL